jgi:hypothetical protein
VSGHPFDLFAQLLARGVGRRDVLRALSALAASAALPTLVPTRRTVLARSGAQGDVDEPQPPPYWPPENPLDPPGEVIDDYVDCLAAGNDPESCDRGIPWCDLRSFIADRAFGNLAGLIEITPFLNDCGKPDCLQCCYRPSTNACHSSFIGEDVINCNPRTYGAGTRGVGLTLLLQEPPPDGTCLFTPQVCSHIGMCLQDTVSSASGAGFAITGQGSPSNYLLDPRAIPQRARVFADYALTQARHYIDEYATDSPDALPLQSLNDAVLGRGWATWRQDMAGLTFDLNDPLFRVTDDAGNLIESASRANVGRLFAQLRLLTGLPNLAARLEYVESRVWSAADKSSYLASIPDPDATLEASLDPHLVAILKRIPSLQDYQLFAPALAGEASSAGIYGGMTLGQPPTLLLSATTAGSTATLTATLHDPTATAGLARPLSVDWGDGRVTRHELPATQGTLTVSHPYAAAGRFAIYAVAANNSGLRGAACTVVEVEGGGQIVQHQASATLTLVRMGLPDLTILNLPFTKDARLALYFVDASGQRFRAGRSRIASGPTNITVPVEIGDAYAHNPSRMEIAKLVIEPRHGISTPSGSRIPAFKLSSLLLGVFSTAQMRVIDRAISANVGMLDVYTEGSTTPLPSTALTVNTDGSITIPFLYRTASSAPWQRVERIEIAITPDLFDGFVLDATPTTFVPGTTAMWAERRPHSFTRVAEGSEVFLPLVQK